MTRVSRGLRNCNPGNLRLGTFHYTGECKTSSDSAFRQFESMAWGYRAIFVVLHTYARRHGLRTLTQMITRYAPPVENDTQAYINRVVRSTALPPDTPLDTLDGATMIPLVAAISEVENGVRATIEDVQRGWELFFYDFGVRVR